MSKSRFLIRGVIEGDFANIFSLYKSISTILGGLARTEPEITSEYVAHFMHKSLVNGVQLVIVDQEAEGRIVGEIHCYKLDPKVFGHVLSELTIAVDTAYQGIGLGKLLFQSLLDFVRKNRADIYRVELIARESNVRAIEMYEKLGFIKEGRFKGRIKNHLRQFEADIPMAWFNPNFVE